MKYFVIILILILFSVAIGQKKPVAKPSPTPTASPFDTPQRIDVPGNLKSELLGSELIYSDKPFSPDNSEWFEVPKNFYGNDFDKIFTLLITSFKSKDEFETTAAFNQRLLDGATRKLYGDLSADSLMAFRYDPKTQGINFSSKYDADTQKLKVSFLPKTITVLTETRDSIKDHQGITIKDSEIQELSSYEGQNAYGAKNK